MVMSNHAGLVSLCLVSTTLGAGSFGCATGGAQAASGSSGRLSSADTAPFLNGFFPIGVFSQPQESFSKWKERGINTLLEVPQNHDPVAWDRAAQQLGFRIIRRPLGDGKADKGRKDLLAWSHWDEPDAAGRAPQWTPAFERTYKEWKQIDPTRKVFLNLAGPDVSWFLSRTDSYSKEYASYYPRLLAVTDWVANDLYPSGGYLNQAHASRRGDITLLAEPIKAIRRLTNKPQFCFIELSEIEKGNIAGARCPTALEVRAQIWYAIVHGVRGLFYFPAVVGKGGFRFDGAPPELVAEIKQQNALLQQLSSVLQGEINPVALTPTVSAPIEIGWRSTGDGMLLALVNPSRQPISGVRVQLPNNFNTGANLMNGRPVKVIDRIARLDFAPLEVCLLNLTNK